MNIQKDSTWYRKATEKPEEAVEDEIRQLASDIQKVFETCTSNGQITDAFSGHLHYLTLFPKISGTVKRVDKICFDYEILDFKQLRGQLLLLKSELILFLEYVLKGEGAGGAKF